MGKTKTRGKYQGVSLPVPFIQEIKNHILKDDKYKSIAEFIKESVREKISQENELFMKNFYGENGYNDIKSGVPFEKFIKDKLGKVLEDKTEQQKKADPTLIKIADSIKKIEKRITAMEKENKKKND